MEFVFMFVMIGCLMAIGLLVHRMLTKPLYSEEDQIRRRRMAYLKYRD